VKISRDYLHRRLREFDEIQLEIKELKKEVSRTAL